MPGRRHAAGRPGSGGRAGSKPTIDVVLDGAALTARARMNGNNHRKMLKQITVHWAANGADMIQGVLRPPAALGRPYMLEGAGSQVVIKARRPAESGGEPPKG